MSDYSLIDANAIGHANHNTSKLTIGEREVQAIYGTLRQLQTIIREYSNFRPLVLWDQRAQWRFDLYPHYKGKRDDDEKKRAKKKAYKEQVPTLRRAMHLLGLDQMAVQGYEADDIAGYYSEALSAKGNNVLLVTGDQDWLQLVNEYVFWYDPIRKQLVNHKTFAEFTGYPDAESFVQAKALTGDTSDNIQGVGGIGDKGAMDFLMQYGSADVFFQLADEGKLPAKLPKAFSRFANNEYPPSSRAKDAPEPSPMRDAYRRNLQLMDLRGIKPFQPDQVRLIRGGFDEDKFRELCEELMFASILRQFDTWIKPFKSRSNT